MSRLRPRWRRAQPRRAQLALPRPRPTRPARTRPARLGRRDLGRRDLGRRDLGRRGLGRRGLGRRGLGRGDVRSGRGLGSSRGPRGALLVVLGPGLVGLGRVLDGGADVVALIVVGVLAEVLLVLGGHHATLGGLLDRQADPAALEIEVDDLDPQLLAGSDHLLGQIDVVGGHLRDVHQALDAVAHLHEGAERHELGDPAVDQLADAVAGGELLPRVLLRGLERQADALAGQVDIEHLHLDLVAHGHDGARVVDVLPRQLGHVDEAVHATEVDEGAEVHDARHDTLAHLAGLEVGEEVLALLALRLLEPGPAGQHDVVAVLVELDDLGLERLADVGLQVANPAQLDERGGQEAAQPDVEDQAALDDLDDRAGHDPVFLLDALDVAPRALVLRPLLGQDQAAVLVLLGEHQGLDLVAYVHDLVGVDVVADRQLAARDHALGLVADVEQHLVAVDAHHRAGDHGAILDGHEGRIDGVGEAAAEVVVDDLARGVPRLCAHVAIGGGRRGGGIGRLGVGHERVGFLRGSGSADCGSRWRRDSHEGAQHSAFGRG